MRPELFPTTGVEKAVLNLTRGFREWFLLLGMDEFVDRVDALHSELKAAFT